MITDERPAGTGVTREERRALALLANDPNGVTEAMLGPMARALGIIQNKLQLAVFPFP
jgi:hypothetical protein